MHRLCFTLFVSLCVGELPFHSIVVNKNFPYCIILLCVCACVYVGSVRYVHVCTYVHAYVHTIF